MSFIPGFHQPCGTGSFEEKGGTSAIERVLVPRFRTSDWRSRSASRSTMTAATDRLCSQAARARARMPARQMIALTREWVLLIAGVIFDLHRHDPFPLPHGLRLSNRCQNEGLPIAGEVVTDPQSLPDHLLEVCYWYFVTHSGLMNLFLERRRYHKHAVQPLTVKDFTLP